MHYPTHLQGETPSLNIRNEHLETSRTSSPPMSLQLQQGCLSRHEREQPKSNSRTRNTIYDIHFLIL